MVRKNAFSGTFFYQGSYFRRFFCRGPFFQILYFGVPGEIIIIFQIIFPDAPDREIDIEDCFQL